MLRKVLSLLVVLLVGFGATAKAEERASREEAIAMCEKAVALFNAEGKDAAFEAINNGADFHDRELYVFVYDGTGTNVAHGTSARLIGKNLINLRDSDGKEMIKAIVNVADKDWVDFKWKNPKTKKVEAKSAYIIHAGDYFFGVGIYLAD